MILQNRKENEINVEGALADIKMELDTDSTAHLMMLLSTNLYQDSLGTPLQEICSNALDSTVEAGVDEPIIVALTRNTAGEYEFSCEDFGLGLDDDDFRNIMSKYGKSTKRENENVLGCLGIGSKSFFAYTDMYTYICRKNQVERMYILRKDEVGFAINLIYEKPTEERNGVKVIVPVKRGDANDFHNAMTNKLAFFENVYFISEYSSISNDYKILETEDFKYSPLSTGSKMKLLLGRVAYEIKFDALGINEIHVPIALKFGLNDGLFPSPNREQIIMSKETKEKILEKINKVADYFIQKYNEGLVEIDNPRTLYNHYRSRLRYVTIEDREFEINDLLKHGTEKIQDPTYKGIKALDLSYIGILYPRLLKVYNCRGEISYDKFTSKSEFNIVDYLNEDKKIINIDVELKGKMKTYLKDKFRRVYFVKKVKDYSLGFTDPKESYQNTNFHYYRLLDLKKYSEDQWEQVIADFHVLEKYYEDKLIPLSSITIDPEWEEARKKARKVDYSYTKKLEGEINFKFATRLEKYVQNKNCKFVGEVVNLKDLNTFKKVLVYGLEEQRQKLDDLYVINKGGIERLSIAIVGQQDYKKLKDIKHHNLMTIEQYESDFHKSIARFVTAKKACRVLNKYSILRNNYDYIKTYINEDLGKCIETLYDYSRKYNNPDNDLMQSLELFCDQHKYYDWEIYPLINQLEKQAPKLDFLVFMTNGGYGYSAGNIQKSDQAKAFIQETLKNRKFKMDWKHYNLPKPKQLSLGLDENEISSVTN